MDAIELMEQRFVHRTDSYVIQTYKEDKGVSYFRPRLGDCPKSPPCKKYNCEHVQDEPLTRKALYNHIMGKDTIGIFQLGEDNTVKWAVMDVDIRKGAVGEDLREAAQQQTRFLAKTVYGLIGSRFLIEDSGNRGYHLWIFFSEPVQARYALALIDYARVNTPTVDNITIEVFPKQTAMRSYGNLMKLPLGVHRKTGNRCLFVNNQFERHEKQLELLNNIPLLTEAELCGIIEQHNMEVPSSIRLEPNGQEGKPGKTGLPCISRIMREGVGEGARDLAMFKVGCFMRDRGLPLDMATDALHVLNKRFSPPLDEEHLEEKITSAYSVDYSPFPCGEIELDHYCSSSCRFWSSKLSDRWTRYGKKDQDAVGKISRD